MEDEFAALLQNGTWDIVQRPPRANIVSGKWIFKHKFHEDGSLERYMARWVLSGFSQRPGVDFDEIFSPVVKPATVRTGAFSSVDNSSAGCEECFSPWDCQKTIYCAHLAGFEDQTHPDFFVS